MPALWDLCTVKKRIPQGHSVTAAWSPCSKFIAICVSNFETVQILDAVTLEGLSTLPSTSHTGFPNELVFSQDGYLLTGLFGHLFCSPHFISWDLQTGGLISDIQMDKISSLSLSHSRCGKMLGVLQSDNWSCCIYTYDILSGTCISSYKFDHHIESMVWTHSESPRYTVLGSGFITIWELGPTPSHVSTQVNSLPIPDNLPQRDFLLSPSLSQIAFVHQQRVLVWDTQHCKILLDSSADQGATNMTFSFDGHFFAYGTSGPELYLWKKSPNGYLLHQKIISGIGPTQPVISPDRESIITCCHSMVQLWHIASFPTSLSDIPTQAPQDTHEGFILDFSPDEKMVAVTGKLGKGINVLDLRSGYLKLAIDTAVEVYTMRLIGNAIIVCYHNGKIITWDIPTGNHTLDTRVNTQNSAQTTVLESLFPPSTRKSEISISPNLSNIAIVKHDIWSGMTLQLYNMDTGRPFLVNTPLPGPTIIAPVWLPTLWYTPDGSEIWYAPSEKSLLQRKIIKDGESNITGLECLQSTEHPPGGCPWDSSNGYQVMDDGWIFNSSGKRLLWLPHHWQWHKTTRRWSGKFLALLHSELPEAVILEMEDR